MNKVFTINLGGRLIPIEEPAYEYLKNYIEQLKLAFQSLPEASEIIEDIKERIAELFERKIKPGHVAIVLENVKEVEAIIGLPKDIAEEADLDIEQETYHEENSNTQQDYEAFQEKNFSTKKLTASKTDKVLGGVAGGIARYFNIDPTIVRVLFLLTLGFNGLGLLVYVILWIALPVSDDQPTQWIKRIYRDVNHKVIGGVCSGIAKYFNINVVLVRLIALFPLIIALIPVITFTNAGRGFSTIGWMFSLPTMTIIYIVLWIAIPAPKTSVQQKEMDDSNNRADNYATVIKQMHTPPPFEGTNNYKPKTQKGKSYGWIFIVIIAAFLIFPILSLLFSWPVKIGVISSISYINPSLHAFFFILLPLIFISLIPIYFIIYLVVRLIRQKRFESNYWVGLNVFLLILFLFALMIFSYSMMQYALFN